MTDQTKQLVDAPSPCCIPSKARLAVLEQSQQQAAERSRVICPDTRGMVEIPTGTFTMGTDGENQIPGDGEGPARRITLNGFLMDACTVSNADFRTFIEATDYTTTAEREGWSYVFYQQIPDCTLDSDSYEAMPGVAWWKRVPGATWQHPTGPERPLTRAEDNLPAVHVSYDDALAFVAWKQKRLPTEAEWERAARGGLEGRMYPWGDDLLTPDGAHCCNIWQDDFPHTNTAEDGFPFLCPVDAFEPNALGLYNIAGNTWEWCGDWFSRDFHLHGTRHNPQGPPHGELRVARGGSYLCHASYCHRYRVSARTAAHPAVTTSNIGFRCVSDLPANT
jgi:formylglycine-generating enzyme required for sulfatase activity